MTKQEAISITRRLWNWLAEDGRRKSKAWWPGWKRNGGTVRACEADCACCHYVGVRDANLSREQKEQLEEEHGTNFLCLLFCPLEWPGGTCESFDPEVKQRSGLFTQWSKVASSEGRAKYAKQIAELPERI